jgi:indolepyruvate ferredoxin oxidoreductase
MPRMNAVTLDDKYRASSGRVYVTGSQALVRLPLDQARRDRAAGLRTAGFISGYRGSPLGIYDQALWRAEAVLAAEDVRFSPGVNEDLAAAAVWGTQQVPLLGSARYDGVFGVWYGKGPGVDRSADVIKHANYAGTSAFGGVVALCGDDHAARSSTLAHQSDHALIHCGAPVFHPADIQEYLDLGLHGFALSRYASCWVGFKCVTDIVDGSASVAVDPARLTFNTPDDYAPPAGGLGIRFEVAALAQEARLFEERHRAAQAYVRANGLDRLVFGKSLGRKRLGLVTTGKAYRDVREALARLRIDAQEAERLGLAVFKVAMVWPLEPQAISTFAAECDELLVIEEKRGLIEEQIAYLLFNLPADRRPRLVGKRDEAGQGLVRAVGELDPEQVMRAIVARGRGLQGARLDERLAAALANAPRERATAAEIRPPSFCAGCPHNGSTRVPEGSIAVAGIGCHGMASLTPDRSTVAGGHMGGEGAPWIGQAPFVDRPHIFQNLGDGTYFHSGLLAIRACVAANVNLTYKVLLNGAVGMTGGQPIEGEQFEGEVTGPRVAQQVWSEGVRRIAVVTDDLQKLEPVRREFPVITTFHGRDELDAVQRDLREWKGVSVLIFDQACATERRRMRKRGKAAKATELIYINPDVCEGCGDCGKQSNCIAIEPLETELGRKRRINQSICNQDYSCLKGFCPSFVSVSGGLPRARAAAGLEDADGGDLPEPAVPSVGEGLSLLVTGIGGTGVVTIGAILGMAAHLEGKPCAVLDMSGFAQRNGSVMSHVRFSPSYEDPGQSPRIGGGGAQLVIGCDPIVAASPDSLAAMAPGATVIVNRFVAPTDAFARDPDVRVDLRRLERRIEQRIADGALHTVDATGVATRLLGDAIGANMFLVGYAWQKGALPVGRESIAEAVRLNGAATEMNLRAFALGRLAAERPGAVDHLLGPKAPELDPSDLAAVVRHRMAHLADYQDQALADRYRALVDRVAAAERALGAPDQRLALAVAEVYARLLAYKDEYEVARLFTGPAFARQIEQAFEGEARLTFHLAPPLLARRDPATGRLRKRAFGPWVLGLFRIVAGLKRLRGTVFDPFGRHPHRRMERRLITEYEALVAELLATLTAANRTAAVEVRGFDVVKDASLQAAAQALEAARRTYDAASAGEPARQTADLPVG